MPYQTYYISHTLNYVITALPYLPYYISHTMSHS